MDIIPEIKEKLGENWISAIYQNKIRNLRTRAFRLNIPAKENTAEIYHTLLGVELKTGKVRIACPDLSTARYLQVFARLGCDEIAVPYDITKISTLADELESSWQRTILLFENAVRDKNPPTRGRMRSALITHLRSELSDIGAGEIMPEFRQSTKQRVN